MLEQQYQKIVLLGAINLITSISENRVEDEDERQAKDTEKKIINLCNGSITEACIKDLDSAIYDFTEEKGLADYFDDFSKFEGIAQKLFKLYYGDSKKLEFK